MIICLVLIDNSKKLFEFCVGWKLVALDNILIENFMHFDM